MQVTGLLSSLVGKYISPLRRKRKSPTTAHRRFYKQGFMTNEIEALQSIFRTQSSQHTDKPK